MCICWIPSVGTLPVIIPHLTSTIPATRLLPSRQEIEVFFSGIVTHTREKTWICWLPRSTNKWQPDHSTVKFIPPGSEFLTSFLSNTLKKSREQTTKHQLRGIRQCRKKKPSKQPSLNILRNKRWYLCSGCHFKKRQRRNLLLEINSMLSLLSLLAKIKSRN